MLEPNDIAFRMLCKKAGAGLVYTGMVSPLTKDEIVLDDKPAIQIFCNTPRGVREFIKKYDKKVSLWDLNLGCPSDLAKKHGFGCYLHPKIGEIEKILQEMRKTTKKPITIKIRISNRTCEIIKIAEKYCDAICIHPRTKEQGYSGQPDIEFARKVKKEIGIPLIYSGNVNEKNAQALLKEFDFVMVGRSAIGNPNIFAKLNNSKVIKNPFKDYLKLAKKYKLKFAQIKTQSMNFTKGIKGAGKIREKLSKAKTIEEIEKIYGF